MFSEALLWCAILILLRRDESIICTDVTEQRIAGFCTDTRRMLAP